MLLLTYDMQGKEPSVLPAGEQFYFKWYTKTNKGNFADRNRKENKDFVLLNVTSFVLQAGYA